jgi:outer membrane protein TolC
MIAKRKLSLSLPSLLLLATGSTVAFAQGTEAAPPAPTNPPQMPEDMPLSLDAALTLSETNNLGLIIEDITSEVSRFNAKGAEGKFDWVLGAELRYTDFQQSPASLNQGNFQLEGTTEFFSMSLSRPLESGGSISADYSSNRTGTNQLNALSPSETTDALRVNFTQPLLRGFGVERATSEQRESEMLYTQQLERRREVLQTLLSDTANTYWDWVQAGKQLEVALSSSNLGEEQLQRNQRLLDAGVGTEVDVIQAEAEVAKRGETRLAAEVAVDVAEDALKVLLFPGTDTVRWNTQLTPSTPLPEDVNVAELPDWTELLEGALRRRPELQQLRVELALAKLRHERSISDRRYGVDFTADMNSQGQDPGWLTAKSEVFEFEALSWTAGLSIDAPLQNRTRAYAERAARAQLRAAHLRYDGQETTIVSELRDAVRQLRYQSLAVNAARESLRAARRQLEAEEARYENDLSTNFQVLEYQLRLVEAMNNVQASRANFAKAIFQLQAAKGTLGENR